MDIDAQLVLEDVLEQNKQLTLQLSVSRVLIKELQKQVDSLRASAEKQEDK